jgi:hypothetical protein
MSEERDDGESEPDRRNGDWDRLVDVHERHAAGRALTLFVVVSVGPAVAGTGLYRLFERL